MIYIVYVSRASRPYSEEELWYLLDVSRRNNEKTGVTGMLLYRGGHFFQTLEGPPEAVRDTFDKICRDPRHRDVVKLVERPTQERSFADWSMGFRNANKLSEESQEAINVFLSEPAQPSAADARGGLVYKLLLQFRESLIA